MGSYMNFGDHGQPENNGNNLAGNLELARQPSIYSLTFDEFQNTMGGSGKDFGSMNMDELLKNIWTAEETQAMASVTSSVGEGTGNLPCENLQRQGSLTLPRTLSQKTVDEVWRDLLKESCGVKDASGNGGTNLPQRQATLGEMTLEEFLVRAGVVREEIQPTGKPNNGGFYNELSRSNNGYSGLSLGFRQPVHTQGLSTNQIAECQTAISSPSPQRALNVGGVKVSLQPLQQQQHQHLQLQPQSQPLFPKHATVAFGSAMPVANNTQLSSPVTKSSIVGTADSSTNTTLAQGGLIQNGGMGLASLGNRVTSVASGSPGSQLNSGAITKSNLDPSSLSSSPYALSESLRGRKSNNSLEKVVERRRRRMIKNRESAARSRARKQAYTLELEAEVENLKELNQELRKKQAELMEMQKNQMLEALNKPWGGKKRCLRRTLTGPW